MSYCKGVVTRVVQHGGCLEVMVSGKSPGAFPIDNGCAWAILDAEGPGWVGRPVEYRDGFMRFLDTAPATPAPQSAPTPCPQPIS